MSTDASWLIIGQVDRDSDDGRVFASERHDAAFADPIEIATTGGTADRFGHAVFVDGDVALVGAPLAGGGTGAVYIFELVTER